MVDAAVDAVDTVADVVVAVGVVVGVVVHAVAVVDVCIADIEAVESVESLYLLFDSTSCDNISISINSM